MKRADGGATARGRRGGTIVAGGLCAALLLGTAAGRAQDAGDPSGGMANPPMMQPPTNGSTGGQLGMPQGMPPQPGAGLMMGGAQPGMPPMPQAMPPQPGTGPVMGGGQPGMPPVGQGMPPQPGAGPAMGGQAGMPQPSPAPARTFGGEDQNFGVPPQGELQANVGSPTPTQIPGGGVILTVQLANNIRSGQLVVIDAWNEPTHPRLPGAVYLPLAGSAGGLDDGVEAQLQGALGQITRGNPQAILVFYCAGPICWESYNAALRAIHLGYRSVLWYRGGVAAWRAAGLPVVQAGATAPAQPYPQQPNPYGQQGGYPQPQQGGYQQPGGLQQPNAYPQQNPYQQPNGYQQQ